ncbi:LEA/WHy family protein [Roseateles koreensis]|uniref:LEA type 2 family protein n=1 Tax=Roseateles koreensis TaxID=2987526 RepID=A0ABT5KUL0_9BURK|nr:LEA type 2 family protein [Roseateles koreensis]MDC8786496.1 LEA type 2 family protein [Roseateles koreensis]
MNTAHHLTRRRLLGHTLAPAALLWLSGCATLNSRDPLRVNVVGVEPMAGEGLELRLLVKLRVQNPNDLPIEFDGAAIDLELNGKSFASGVSNQKGEVPRYGETLLNLPLTISAFAAVRQAMSFNDVAEQGELPYMLTGKLAGGLFGTVRFSSKGLLKLPK